MQAVGGVNEKIEGFFRLCQARGLTGEQGAIVPHSNVPNLMLDQSVLDAVKEGLFSVYAVRHVDEAMVLLSGREVGSANDRGEYPDGSVNALVVERLREICERDQEREEEGETDTQKD